MTSCFVYQLMLCVNKEKQQGYHKAFGMTQLRIKPSLPASKRTV